MEVKTDYPDRQTEMMICMKEQGYCSTLDGKAISFPIEVMIDMWDILKADKIDRIRELEWLIKYNKAPGMHTFHMCECGKKGCRRYKCNECIKKELDAFGRKNDGN